MKCVFILSLFVLSVSSYPAPIFSSEEDSDERPFALFPSLHRRTFSDSFRPRVVQVDVGGEDDSDDDDSTDSFMRGFFRPILVNPFAGARFPSIFSSGFPTNTDGFMGEPTNSSSTTQVINGHKVVKNDTTYESDGAFWRIQVIRISPTDDSEGSADASPEAEAPETPAAPETPEKSPEETSTPKGDDNTQNNDINREEMSINWRHADHDEAVEVFTDSEEARKMKYVDLSDDLRVNEIMADQAQTHMVQLDPDVELFDAEQGGDIQPYFSEGRYIEDSQNSQQVKDPEQDSQSSEAQSFE